MDYGKFKYENAQKAREARRNQTNTVIKEMKLRPKIDQHDYETKKGHVVRFLRQGDKVKVTIMFRGREVTHPERGVMILDRLAEELADLCQIDQRPIQDGRNMTMLLSPSKAVLNGTLEQELADREEAALALAATKAEDAAAIEADTSEPIVVDDTVIDDEVEVEVAQDAPEIAAAEDAPEVQEQLDDEVPADAVPEVGTDAEPA